MADAQVASTILAESSDHEVNGVMVRVSPFISYANSEHAQSEEVSQEGECYGDYADQETLAQLDFRSFQKHSESDRAIFGWCESPSNLSSPRLNSTGARTDHIGGPFTYLVLGQLFANITAQELQNAAPEYYEE